MKANVCSGSDAVNSSTMLAPGSLTSRPPSTPSAQTAAEALAAAVDGASTDDVRAQSRTIRCMTWR